MKRQCTFIVFVVTSGLLILTNLLMKNIFPQTLFDKSVMQSKLKYQNIVQEMQDACGTTHQNNSYEDLLCMDASNFLQNFKNPCWMHDKRTLRCLPYFYLIGNAKSGTSDFFKRILMHPDILGNKGFLHKETAYWSRRRFGYQHGLHGGVNISIATFNWFTRFFDAAKLRNAENGEGFHYKITGLGDPMDFYDRFHDDLMPQNERDAEELQLTTPHVIKHLNPTVKLLLLLRDPIERLYSHYFFGSYGKSSQSFHNDTLQSIGIWKECLETHSKRHCAYSRALEIKYNCPIYVGFYNIHLREWMNAFPRDQFLIFRNEDYARDIRGTLINVFHYLNISIPNDEILKNMSAMSHFRSTPGKYKAGPMLTETRNLLVDFYRPYLEDLAKLLNDDRYLFRDINFS